jgi:hypothetical protein
VRAALGAPSAAPAHSGPAADEDAPELPWDAAAAEAVLGRSLAAQLGALRSAAADEARASAAAERALLAAFAPSGPRP